MRLSMYPERLLTRIVWAQLNGIKSRVINCTECHMDLLLQTFLDSEEKRTAMVVTRWPTSVLA